MASKDGWTHDRDHEKISLGKKQYRNMEEWSRPCAACQKSFSIFVRQNTTGINSNFGYRNCKEHRGQKVGAAGVDTEVLEELQGLRELAVEWGAVWKACHPLLIAHGLVGIDTFAAALQRLAEHDRAAFEEVQVLKAKLAQFDLSTAFAAIGCEPVQNTTGSKLTFPWQTD